MRCTRRTFMQVLGTGALAFGLPGCTGGSEKAALAARFARWTERGEEWKSSICRLCPGGCGLKVRVIDGLPVQVLGNPLHPVNRGGICPRAAASLDLVADPDRIRGPLARDGQRGVGRWRSISWDEATSQVTAKLAELRSAETPEALVILDGEEPGIRAELLARFARAYGTPNHIRYRALEPERIALTHALMQGGEAPLACDLARASYVLCFGTGLLESWISPVSQMRALADLRGSKGRGDGRIVVIEPRLSVTGARADRWVPIRPGTEAALALGIAYVIIREALLDRDFIEAHTFGFDDWTDEAGRTHFGFRTLVLSEYNPRVVSEITGVRTETILVLARELAAVKPAVAIGEPEYSRGTNDFYARMAIHALNALTGNLGPEGAFSIQGRPPVTPFPALALDATAESGLRRARLDGAGEGVHFLTHDAVQALPERLLTGRPYSIGAVFLVGANPVFSHPAGGEFARALAAVPLVVSTSAFLDESAALADLVLPDALFLQRWDAVVDQHHSGFSLVSVGEPVMKPLEDVRDTADVILAIAAGLGGAVASALPWSSSREVIELACRGLFAAERGYVVSNELEEAFRRILERQGFRDPEFSSFDDFWAGLLARGAWWDPTDSTNDLKALLRNPSQRFEFHSRELEGLFKSEVRRLAGNDAETQAQAWERFRAELGVAAEGDRLFLPHYEAQRASAEDGRYPLRLLPFTLLALGMGEMVNSPWIQEGLATHVPAAWDSWVEINPATAREAGIEDGSEVWVESPRGRLRTRARLYEGTMPGVVAMPLGQGHQALGRVARGRGVNPLALVSHAVDSRAGMAVLGLTQVRIVKA